MKAWVITAVIIGVLLIAGIFLVNALSADTKKINSETPSCSGSCGNSCTSGSNCGQPTCGAIKGGSCGCR